MVTTTEKSGKSIAAILAEKGLDGNSRYWRQRLAEVSDRQVEQALAMPAGLYRPEKLLALVSPAAERYLEQMARQARRLTIQRFGKTVRLYAPLYLSNYCVNSCRYCGFNSKLSFERTRLTVEQAVKEAELIASQGLRDILLVSSEDRRFIGVDYLSELARKLRERFSFIAMEIYSLSRAGYERLFKAGIEGVTLYQETYDRGLYRYYHPAGPKADYDDRLDAPGRIGSAGMREIGLGVLLGLGDWRIESLALAEHAHYLMRRYWRSHISFSFPRIRPASAVSDRQFRRLSDRNLVQMITALRLCFGDAGLVLSTREPAWLRDRLIGLGITKTSAGSKTSPGGYCGGGSLRQFEVDDNRRVCEVADAIRSSGLEPVWKDWDRGFVQD